MTASDIDWRDFGTFGGQRVTPGEPDPNHPLVFTPLVGDHVKLMWPLGESMWVAVDAIGENGGLTGTLANSPITVPLNYGDRIWFSASDIVRLMPASATGAA